MRYRVSKFKLVIVIIDFKRYPSTYCFNVLIVATFKIRKNIYLNHNL